MDYINKVICGKAEEVLQDIASDSIPMYLTSPPYDNLRTYSGSDWNFNIFTKIADQMTRTLKPGGIIVWVVGDAVVGGSETLSSFEQALYFKKECSLRMHDTMIYEKANFSNPSSNRYHQIFEFMYVFSKGKPNTFNPILDKKNKYGVCWGKNTVRQKNGEMTEVKKNKPREFGMRTNIWRMNTVGQETPCKARKHPAQFPYKLAHDHILSWSNEGDLVVDPMAGGFTTCKAAKDLNRKYLGVDISKEYCNWGEAELQ